MKKYILLLCLVGTAFAQNFDTDYPQQSVPLAEFGPGGYFEPNFMGEALPDSFYNTFRTKSATNGLNYMGLVQNLFPREGSFHQKGDVLLTLANNNDLPANIVISLTSDVEGKVQNFVVTLLEYESHVISLAGYERFDNLHLISGEAFEASLQRAGQRNAGTVEIAAPRSYESGGYPDCDFCSEETEKMVMQGLDSSGNPVGSTWFAYIRRYETNSVLDYWGIDVEYPNPGDTFHQYTGSSTQTNPACKIFSSSTKRVGGTKKHTWKHINGYDPLDDVLYDHKEDGKAVCYSGCSTTEEFTFRRYVARHCDPY